MYTIMIENGKKINQVIIHIYVIIIIWQKCYVKMFDRSCFVEDLNIFKQTDLYLKHKEGQKLTVKAPKPDTQL